MKSLKKIKEVAVVLVLIFVFRSSILNWYVIPSGSMLPTLKIGDHVVVNKLAYGLMPPFSNTQILNWSHPQRGDVIVFRGPKSEGQQTFIKRVLGLPGDKIQFKNGILTVNGIQAKESIQTDRSILSDLLAGSESINEDELILESEMSVFSHYILRKKEGGFTANDSHVWTVPSKKLLCIGDNRDNSYDGRFWGFINERSVYGKAFVISFSTGGNSGIWPYFRMKRWLMKITN